MTTYWPELCPISNRLTFIWYLAIVHWNLETKQLFIWTSNFRRTCLSEYPMTNIQRTRLPEYPTSNIQRTWLTWNWASVWSDACLMRQFLATLMRKSRKAEKCECYGSMKLIWLKVIVSHIQQKSDISKKYVISHAKSA